MIVKNGDNNIFIDYELNPTLYVNKTNYNIHFICHSHLDAGWLRTIDAYYKICVKSILQGIVPELINNEKRKFVWAEIGYLERYWNNDATADWKAQFKSLVLSRRIEFVGGGFVQADEGCTSSEGFLFNIEVGYKFIVDNFGENYLPDTAWQIDPFGYTKKGSIMEAYSKSTNLVLHRIGEGLRERLKLNRDINFLWRPNGKNSSELFVTILQDSYTWPPTWMAPLDSFSPINISQFLTVALKTIEDKIPNTNTNNIFMVVGGDFTFNVPKNSFSKIDDLMNIINSDPILSTKFNARYSTVSDYITDSKQYYILNKEKAKIKLYYEQDFMYYSQLDESYWVGYYTSKPNLKRSISYTIRQTMGVQTLIAMRLDKGGDMNMLSDIIRNTTYLMHHDAITGTCRQDVLLDYQKRIDYANNQTTTLLRDFIKYSTGNTVERVTNTTINHNILETRYRRLVLLNPTGWTKKQIVTLKVNALYRDFCPFTITNTSLKVLQLDCVYDSLNHYYILEFFINMRPFSTKSVYLKSILLPSPFSNYKIFQNTRGPYFGVSQYEVAFNESTKLLDYILIKSNNNQRVELNQKPWGPGIEVNDINATSQLIIGWNTIEYRSNRFDANVTSRFFTSGDQEFDLNIDFTYELTVPRNVDKMVRFETNINNTNLYSDDGLSYVQRSITNNKLTQMPQKFFYPSVTSSTIFDNITSFVCYSDRSKGVSGLDVGFMEFALHRNSEYDDNKGLGEPPIDDSKAVIQHRCRFDNQTQIFKNYWRRSRDFLNAVEVFDTNSYFLQAGTEPDWKPPISDFQNTDIQLLTLKRIRNDTLHLTLYNSSPNLTDTCYFDLTSFFRAIEVKSIQEVSISGYGFMSEISSNSGSSNGSSSALSRKRVTVFPNGKRLGGKAISIPKKWSEFLKIVSKKLLIPVTRIYNEDGGEIDEIDLLVPKEVLFASCGESFIKPGELTNTLSPIVSNTSNNNNNNNSNNNNNNNTIPTFLYHDNVSTTTSAGVSRIRSTTLDYDASDWVTLNVGGRIFSTTRSTLLKDKDSMLAKMFGESWDSTRDINGNYLIDRSPEYFAPIINFLRCGNLIIDDGVNVEGVYLEARFFNITGMLDRLSAMVERKMQTDVFTRKDVISILLTSSSNSSLRCQGLNLSGVDLSKLDLRNINFKMTNFRETNLSKCNLDNALLQEADLSYANLCGASLRGANLSGANLEHCILKGTNFEDRGGQRATLESCNFKNAILEEANFSGANLRVANFKGANLENCNFRGADLAGANLEDTNLRGANLHKANLIGVNLRGANFDIRTVSSRLGSIHETKEFD
ncbi:BTB/POZ domain-containing protein [Heterostelium album PN500]|uniref:alpha-mannosidase n=1 Tax=Heterostelium pallidum (strain ATCC 26659 / Pp 5 / PN500) TaxID=670386 RepID=D3B6R4_HETP5|nr:BTB/POZ domain-containing protein [Heterostelium album PN500]EFA83034.1 BTB/POZ domain-containing protein [Heterostelium album PN500]|eukprot:XP_020435151.1 BTB/POZ domain-containing protein [Heterostelium album PN500]